MSLDTDPSQLSECVNITYEINHQDSVRLADDLGRVASTTTASLPSGVLAVVAVAYIGPRYCLSVGFVPSLPWCARADCG